MSLPGTIAVTGAGGRLGMALINRLSGSGSGSAGVPWRRPEFDLDAPADVARLIERDRPGLVIHCAAWTDVDGCARDPALAMARNAGATEVLATACAERRVPLVVLSTNEVFDGARKDGRGYAETDGVGPINAYGRSKLAAEEVARAAFGRHGPALWIVRTAWLFGAPGNDFPHKVIAASDRLAPGEALRVVDDEYGSPTFSKDLAVALLDLVATGPPDVYHLVPPGSASRFEVAQAVVGALRPSTTVEPISGRDYGRASEPPAWAVLDPARAADLGIRLRDWRNALVEYLSEAGPAYDRLLQQGPGG